MTKAIPPQEAAKRMKEIADNPDNRHDDHIAADALLCQVLRSLGYGEAVCQFKRIKKWYS